MSVQKNFQITVRERGVAIAVGRFLFPDEPFFAEVASRARKWFADEVAEEARARFLSQKDKDRAFYFSPVRYGLTIQHKGKGLLVEASLSWGEGAPLVRTCRVRRWYVCQAKVTNSSLGGSVRAMSKASRRGP